MEFRTLKARIENRLKLRGTADMGPGSGGGAPVTVAAPAKEIAFEGEGGPEQPAAPVGQGSYTLVQDIKTLQAWIDRASAAGIVAFDRSEERRVGKEGVSTCRSRWSPDP